MELEVLRYTNRISSEAHREVSGAQAPRSALVARVGKQHGSEWGERALLRWMVPGWPCPLCHVNG